MSVTERRIADRRHETRPMPNPETAMGENPEVMGRSQPPEAMQPGQATIDLWPDMSEVEVRFMQIQSGFIADPRQAVKKAERLVDEAIDRLTRTLHDRMQAIHRETRDDGDTEQLRLTMWIYREFIQSLVARAAT